MIRFALPWVFLLLPLPWLVRVWFPASEQSRGPALRVPYFEALFDMSTANKPRYRGRIVSAFLIWMLLLVAASQPQWLDEGHPVPTTGRALMMVIDISGSMRTMDFEIGGERLDRLGMVKRVAGRFIEGRVGDRLGLILFGARPYVRSPLTFDHGTVTALLQDAEAALAGEYTALGDAIGLAIKRMRERSSDNRVIIVVTDGANNAGAVPPRQAARLAADLGIRVYAIGIGREDVAAPNPYGAWSSSGAEAFNREVLESVASTTGGQYFNALDRQGMERAYRRLDELEPSLGEARYDYIANPLYMWPLAGALLFSLLLASAVAIRDEGGG